MLRGGALRLSLAATVFAATALISSASWHSAELRLRGIGLAAAEPKQRPMLYVPGGQFTMGADGEGELDERPSHPVQVNGFWLDATEVTQEEYAACVAQKACRPPANLAGSKLVNGRAEVFRRRDHPVVGVSWFDARDYCRFESRRLPTEAEWERAARGDDARKFAWGNAAPDPQRHGVFGGRSTTEPVASFPEGRGPFGHYDLAGNVWEWVEDEYDPYAYHRLGAALGKPGNCTEILAALAELRATGKQGFTGKNPIPVECERVLRGGAYNYGNAGMRASNRVHHPATFRIAVAGFRCAKDGPPP